MLDRPDVKAIALDRVSRLPWVAPPAGYIILIQDVAYGSRYKIARHQQLDRRLLRRGADFPFETKVVRIWQADDAAAAERDLHVEISAGTAIGEWFDLYHYPTASSAPASQDDAVSLRELAQNSGDAESLLQDARIVGAGEAVSTPQAPAGGPAFTPQTAAPAEGRAATSRRPRRVRWAFVLGLLILAGFFVAERSSDIRRAIDSVLDPSSRPAISNRAAAPATIASGTGSRSALPTPAVEGRGEVFFTNTRANVRACANLSCKVIDVLSPGAKIVAQRFAEGQRVNGSDRWIVFRFRGQDANVHSSVVSKVRRISEPSPEPSPTAKPTRVQATAEGYNEEFFVATHIRARLCARLSCAAASMMPRGARITALRYTKGQPINGNDRWIRFYHDGKHVYLHSSHLTRNRPGSAASPTAQPTQSSVTKDGQGEVFYVVAKANARLCALLSCAIVEVFERGNRITALRFQKGQLINGSDRWIRFSHKGKRLSIHSSKLTQTDPQADTVAAAQMDNADEAPSIGGVIYYLKTRARARLCTRLDCDFADVFEKGAKIVAAAGYLLGERINNNGRWIAFRHNGRDLYLHSDLLTKERPKALATPQPTATTHRISVKPTAEGENEIFYVKTEARARTCARLTCSEAQLLWPGMRIIALRYTQGEEIDGSDRWIRFINRGWIQYVHSSFLSREKPTADSSAEESATVPPSLAPDYDEDKLFYVKPGASADVRTCMRSTCHRAAILKSGFEITPILVVNGQSVAGNAKWVMFEMGSHRRFVHTGDLTQIKPSPEPTAEPAPTRPPLRDEYTARNAGQVFYVKSGLTAPVRNCASHNCVEVGTLSQGSQVEAIQIVRGQTIGGSNEWIMFSFNGWNRFVHRGDLSRLKPRLVSTAAATDIPAATEPPPTATEPPPPTATATVPPAAKYVVETAGNVNANIRSCPRTSCDIVAKFKPDTEVDVIGSVKGETVYETDIWLEIRLDGVSAFIHSELVAEAG